MSLQEYKALTEQLLQLRRCNNGQESEEEDALLAKMDDVWKILTTEEVEALAVSYK